MSSVEELKTYDLRKEMSELSQCWFNRDGALDNRQERMEEAARQFAKRWEDFCNGS